MKAAFLCKNKKTIDRVYDISDIEVIKQNFDVYDGVFNRENADRISDVEVIFSTWGMIDFSEREIKEKFPSLKAVFYGAGSVQYFARPFLNLGVKVFSSWLANSVPVIEYALSQIILANKGFFISARKCRSRAGRDEARAYFDSFCGNYNTNVGLIGLGAIGSGVAEMLKNYKLNVLAYDPFCSKEKAEKLGVKLTSLEEIFEKCQTISNHTANLPETVGMLNKSLFSLMKDNATFINTGRGAQVNEEDLIEVLKNKPNICAVLDVTMPEPPLENSPFYTLENVFLTPHIAGSSGEECKRMGKYMTQEALRYLKGEPLKYEVTLKMLETMA